MLTLIWEATAGRRAVDHLSLPVDWSIYLAASLGGSDLLARCKMATVSTSRLGCVVSEKRALFPSNARPHFIPPPPSPLVLFRGATQGVSLSREVAAFIAASGKMDIFDGRSLCWMSYQVRDSVPPRLLPMLPPLPRLHVVAVVVVETGIRRQHIT